MKNIELLQNNGINVVDSVHAFGSIEQYDIQLNKFLNEIAIFLNKLKECKEKNDIPNYLNGIMTLEKISKSLGFTKLLELSILQKEAINKNDIQFVDNHFNELLMEAIRLLTIVRQYNGQTASKSLNNSEKDTIIVADDSNIIRNFVNKIFADEFEILGAKDGNEVISIIEQNRDKNIVGMLLDLNMPNSNGFAVLEYFKQNNLFDQIPISIITGDDTKDSVDKSFQYPIIDMLNKPFTESDVRRIVERTISIHKSLSN